MQRKTLISDLFFGLSLASEPHQSLNYVLMIHTCTIARKRFFTFRNEFLGGPIFGGNWYRVGVGRWDSQFSESVSV